MTSSWREHSFPPKCIYFPTLCILYLPGIDAPYHTPHARPRDNNNNKNRTSNTQSSLWLLLSSPRVVVVATLVLFFDQCHLHQSLLFMMQWQSKRVLAPSTKLSGVCGWRGNKNNDTAVVISTCRRPPPCPLV